MLNLHCAGELSMFLMSTQAPSSNSNPNLFGNDEIVDQSFDSLLTNINPCVYYNNPQSIPNRTPSSNDLLIVHVNIRSLTKNFDDLSHFLSQFSVPPDVICITETRLKNASFVNISIPGYEFVFANSFSSAGGVGVYVSSTIGFSVIAKNVINAGCEDIWVSINCNQTTKKTVMATIYRHPSSDTQLFIQELNNKLLELNLSNANLFLVGDFNINISPINRSTDAQNYLDMLLSSANYPMITKPTRVTPYSSTIIDHIITNCHSNPILPGIIESDFTDHYPVFCILKNIPKCKRSVKSFYRSMKNFDSERFLHDLNSQVNDFDIQNLNENNFNQIFDQFLQLITSTIDFHAPIKLASRKQQKVLSKLWLTRGILTSIRSKQNMHKSHYIHGTFEQKMFYKKYTNKLTKLKTVAKKLHYENEFRSSADNPRLLWKTLNNLLPSKRSAGNSAPKILKINGTSFDQPADIAQSFNNFFCNIGQSLAVQVTATPSSIKPSYYLHNRVTDSIFLAPSYPQEILRIISSLQSSSSCGPDNISSFFLKLGSNILIYPLTIFFNFCVECGIFPDSLKMSKVVPIFKSGDKTDINNYRPISLLPVIAKVFERLLYNRVQSFIEKHNILSTTQYGFRSKFSPEHAVVDIVSSCYDSINDGQFTGLIMLDLKKAFDSVTHYILLQKLEHYGIRGKAFNLFSSYLSNRQQYVSLQGINSSTLRIEYGVPQGSVLGPLLFLLYINDLTNSINTTPRLFADDTCIIANAPSATVLEQTLNREMTNLSMWINANKLTVNPSKSYALIISPNAKIDPPILNISYNHSPVKVVNSVKYLGIVLDNKLQFKQHIALLESKLSRSLGFLFKTKSFLPKDILKKLYYAFIHSHLNFGLIIWSATPKSNLLKLRSIQSKAIRVLAGADWYEHASPLYVKLNILSLDKLILYALAKFMHKYYLKCLPSSFNNYFTLVPSIHSCHTRNATKSNQYFLPQFSTSLLLRTIKFKGAKLWNDIPENLRKLSHKQFLLKYKAMLLNSSS